MAFNVKYRIEFSTKLGKAVKIDFEEDGTFTIQQLTAANEIPLILEWNDGAFDKLIPIRQGSAKIYIKQSGVNISDFITTSDKQTKVKIYYNDTLEWIGWLYSDRIGTTLTDRDEVIELTAKDGLHLLPSAKLQDLSDTDVWSLTTAKDWITYCLDKTDLGLDWYSFNNAYQVGSPARTSTAQGDSEPFFWLNIAPQSLLKNARDFDDPFTVLENILKSNCCTLFQARGAWQIVHLNDRIAADLDYTRYNASGIAQDYALNQSYQIAIGKSQSQKFINADAATSVERPYKSVEVDYEYNYPAAYFRNFDLEEGSVNFPRTTTNRTVLDISHWIEDSGNAYIGKELDSNGFETFRYLFVEPTGPNWDTGQAIVKTTRLYVPAGVKIRYSHEERERNFNPREGRHVVYMKLITPTKTYYFDALGRWTDLTGVSQLQLFIRLGYFYDGGEVRDVWRSFEQEANDPTPEAGYIQIEYHGAASNQTSSNEIRWRNITFEILNQVPDNFSSVSKGIRYKTEQSLNYAGVLNETLRFSDTRNVALNGAYLNSSWAEIAKVKYYSAADNTAVPFQQFMKRVMYKAVYRNYQRIQGRILNLYNSRLISLLNTFTVDGISNKEFMPTTMRMDVRNEQAEIDLIELRATNNTNDFDANSTESQTLIDARAEDFENVNSDISFRWGAIGAGVQRVMLPRKFLRSRNPYG